MAFKILSEEERSLLTADQLAHYEKELDIYKQRAAFVEKMTELEKAEIKPYKPALKPVGVIKKLEISSFTKPERKQLDFKSTAKPRISQNLLGKAVRKIDASEFVKSDISFKETIRRNFNNNFALTFEKNKFKIYEQKQYTLPTFSKPVMPDISFTKLENVLSESVQVKKPAAFNLKPFTAPANTEIVLSKISKPDIKIGAFIKPESPKLDIEVDLKPETVVKAFEKPKFALAAIPEISKATVKRSVFRQPERIKQEISVKLKAAISVKSFEMPETAVTDMPQMQKTKTEFGVFLPPLQPKLDIALNAVPNFEVKSFEKPELATIDLPEINRAEAVHISFRAPERRKLNLEIGVKSDIKIKSFEKTQSVRADIPEIPKVKVKMSAFTKPKAIKPKLNAEIKTFGDVRSFEKPAINKPEVPDIKICKGFEIGEEVQEMLSVIKKETAL